MKKKQGIWNKYNILLSAPGAPLCPTTIRMIQMALITDMRLS